MHPLTAENSAYKKGYSACSGCSLCLLVCPVWRQMKDIRFTSRGRNKALQYGIGMEEIRDSAMACALCNSCDAVCPEGIDLERMLRTLRSKLEQNPAAEKIRSLIDTELKRPRQEQPGGKNVLLPGKTLRTNRTRLPKIIELLGGESEASVAADDGWDIALALEAGLDIPEERFHCFFERLRGTAMVVITDGILKILLKNRFPGIAVKSLGEALSSVGKIRNGLRPTDLYIIESRAYNCDFDRMIKYYHRLGKTCGCAFNLDLNRIAIPTTATSFQSRLGLEGIDFRKEAKWILEGRDVERIVVENPEDEEAFREITRIPVVHLADLADEVGDRDT